MTDDKTPAGTTTQLSPADPVIPQRTVVMPGLYYESVPGKQWKTRVDNIDVLRRALGDDLVNGVIRCLGVCDRLMTILDCLPMNEPHTSTLRAERNHNVLGVFAVALVYELREGISSSPTAASPSG